MWGCEEKLHAASFTLHAKQPVLTVDGHLWTVYYFSRFTFYISRLIVV